MLSKRRYIMLTLFSVLLFSLFAIYIGSLEVPEKTNIAPEVTTIDTVVLQEESKILVESQILPSTNIKIILKDQEDNIITVNEIDPYSVMCLDEQDFKNVFPDYEIIEFNQHQVTLSGNTYIEPEEVIYYMGSRDNEIGIVLGNDFQIIGLKADGFSGYTNTLLTHELIAITSKDKIKLEEDPNYFERILQNLSE
ncbi:MAG: hypothetical protein BEN19_02035 [Epulopiscium sp. Nuni2H_MBin003]|nr:MAG: hypothetical protein BEN19_02035 [Epulopiscium sp. Nuni2H_MBin003]